MRTLFKFIWTNHFVFLFIFLEFISSLLIIQNNSFQKANFINSSNIIAASVLQISRFVKEYIGLKTTNELLARENERLYSQSILSFAKHYKGNFYHNDTLYKQQYAMLSAKVISNSVYRRNNYLTLDKGSNQGVLPEMGVISGNGIVGIVKNVSENFCSVMSVLHKNTRISAKIKKSGYFGSLVWDGKDIRFANLLDIPIHVNLIPGDTIVTSGYSSIFPEGIEIGTVADFEIKPGDNFITVSVKFSGDFSNLTYVYVVNYLMKEEQKNLKEKSQNDQ